MVHLGVSDFFLQAANLECRSYFDSIGPARPEQQLERPCEFSAVKVFRFFDRRFPWPTTAQISSPWSQKAAALVPDPEAVDIR
jgi:hypothetical protein